MPKFNVKLLFIFLLIFILKITPALAADPEPFTVILGQDQVRYSANYTFVEKNSYDTDPEILEANTDGKQAHIQIAANHGQVGTAQVLLGLYFVVQQGSSGVTSQEAEITSVLEYRLCANVHENGWFPAAANIFTYPDEGTQTDEVVLYNSGSNAVSKTVTISNRCILTAGSQTSFTVTNIQGQAEGNPNPGYEDAFASVVASVSIKEIKIRFSPGPEAEFSWSEGYQLSGPSPNIWVEQNAKGWFARYTPEGVYYTLDASESYAPDNINAENKGIVSYFWDISGKSSQETISWTKLDNIGQRITCVFPRDDIYEVRLIVTDVNGNEGTIVKEVKVVLPPAVIKGGADGENITWSGTGLGGMPVPINMGGIWASTYILYKDLDTASFLWWVKTTYATCYPPGDKTYYVASLNDKQVDVVRAQDWNSSPEYKIIGGYDSFNPANFQMTSPSGFARVIQDYMNYKVKSIQAVLGEGAVQSSETKEQSIPVDSSATKIIIGLSWPGSSMDLILRMPDGTWVTPATFAYIPNIACMQGPTYRAYMIIDPKPGSWTAYISGLEVDAAEGEPYKLNALTYLRLGLTNPALHLLLMD